MKNESAWRPSKYVYAGGRLAASRDRREVSASSRLMVDRIAQAYDAALSRHARGRLLDLGCGKVPLYQAYGALVDETVCVDWPHSPHAARHLDLEHDLTRPLPFPDEAFDTILLSDVLEHIPEPEVLWGECHRVLAPGGTLLLNVPFLYWLHETPHDFYRYTEFALRRFADAAGFTVLELEPLGGAPEVLADIVAKSIRRIRFLGTPLGLAVQAAAAAFTRTRAGRRFAATSSRSLPLGYFLVARKNPPA